MNRNYNNIIETFIINNKNIHNKYNIEYLDGIYFKNNLKNNKKNKDTINNIDPDGLNKKYLNYDNLDLKHKKLVFLCDCCNKYFKKDMYISWYLNNIFFKTCYHCFFKINKDIDLIDGTKYSNYKTIYEYINKHKINHKKDQCNNCLICNHINNKIINVRKNFYKLNKNIINKINKKNLIKENYELNRIKKIKINV